MTAINNVRSIRLPLSTSISAMGVESFEAGIQPGERILAFNLRPSKSQMEGKKAGFREKTWWTATASSFMFGEHDAFYEGLLLVAAHIWDGKTYLPPVAYEKGDKGYYEIVPSAEPSGLSGEIYGAYLARINRQILEKEAARNFYLSEYSDMEKYTQEQMLEAAAEAATLDEALDLLYAERDDLSVFADLCHKVQVKINIPGLSHQEMVATFMELSGGKKQKLLKLRCHLSFSIEKTIKVSIQVTGYKIEDGALASPSRGEHIDSTKGAEYLKQAKAHFSDLRQTSSAARQSAEELISARKTGTAKTQEKNKYRSEQRRKLAAERDATANRDKKETEVATPLSVVEHLGDAFDNIDDLSMETI